MRNKLDVAYLAVLLACFPGYPFIAALAAVGGINSTMMSLAMRSGTVLLSIAIIAVCIGLRRDRFSSNMIILSCVFWLAYILRIFHDTNYYADILGQDVSFYWIWAVGGSFIPMLALASRPQAMERTETYFKAFYYLTFLASILGFFAASGAVVNDLGIASETGRLRIGNSLNPIALGHLGAMLVIQSVWAFIFFRPWHTLSRRLLLLGGLGVGFYLLVAANSRGPVVATFICMSIVLLSVQFRYKFAIASFFVIGAITIIPAARYLEETYGIVSLSRLFGKSVTEQAESSSRLDLYATALDGFWRSPWIGYSMEDPITSSYPHNVIVESFMALGVVFGLILIALLVIMSFRSLSIFRRYPEFGWPSLLFLQYAVGAQFSGALYGSTYLWCAMGLMVSFSLKIWDPISLYSAYRKPILRAQ